MHAYRLVHAAAAAAAAAASKLIRRDATQTKERDAREMTLPRASCSRSITWMSSRAGWVPVRWRPSPAGVAWASWLSSSPSSSSSWPSPPSTSPRKKVCVVRNSFFWRGARCDIPVARTSPLGLGTDRRRVFYRGRWRESPYILLYSFFCRALRGVVLF